MDPNNSIASNPQNSGKEIILVLVIVAIISLVLILGLNYFKKPASQTTAQPTPTAIQTKVEVTPLKTAINTFQGTLKSLEKDKITITSNKETKTLTLSEATNIQKLISGSLEDGSAQLTQASSKDLKAGQELRILFNPDSGNTLSIVISLK